VEQEVDATFKIYRLKNGRPEVGGPKVGGPELGPLEKGGSEDAGVHLLFLSSMHPQRFSRCERRLGLFRRDAMLIHELSDANELSQVAIRLSRYLRLFCWFFVALLFSHPLIEIPL